MIEGSFHRPLRKRIAVTDTVLYIDIDILILPEKKNQERVWRADPPA
jgi:hypothetical protein